MNSPLTSGNPSEPADGVSPKTYQTGTLTYTVAGLVTLFFWLLWGDFCFVIMEKVWASIIPLKIKELQAPNWVIGAIMVSLPQILNLLLNPLISTASDRHRSPWGRRRPFMLIASPFIGILLCVMGFFPEIGRWVYDVGLGRATGWSLGAITVGVIGVVIALFRIAELFISTLFYYFFNDVVPREVIARFLALARVVGLAGGAFYEFFVFQHALTHMRVIFVVAGLLYCIGFVMMCLRVKEGEYPPPSSRPVGAGPLARIRVYVKECLHQKLFVLLYLHTMVWTLASACAAFLVFMYLSLGLTLAQVGILAGITSVATGVLAYPAGMLADRFHPMRVMVWLKLGMVIWMPLNFVWLFTHFAPSVNFKILLGLNVISVIFWQIYAATLMPLYMRLFPREQFGQFCSFLAICTALVGAASGIIAGLYIDRMRRLYPDVIYGQDYCYRLIPGWQLFFASLGLVLLAMVYREWLKRGGEASILHGASVPRSVDDKDDQH